MKVVIKTRTRWLTVLSAFLLLLWVGQALAENESKTFDVGAGGTLIVETDIGAIEVTTGSDRVEADVTWSGGNSDDFSVDFSQNGSEVRISGEYDRGLWGWMSSPKVRIKVSVPERFNVELNTSGGSISVADLDGKVRAKTSGGSLSFGNIEGTVQAKTSGGSIKLEGGSSTADLNTSGGSIKIGDVDGRVRAKTSGGSIVIARARGSVDARTSGGSIKVEEVMGAIQATTSGGSVTAYISEQPDDDCRLSTSGGSVTAYLADGLALDLTAKSSGGRVKSDFDVDASTRTKTALEGTINGGGPELHLRSSGGGVRVLRR